VGDFGEKFRKARETKNVSLLDASDVTKISARMLRAIEEERFDQLPGGVFNKGFIRAYAKYLGINDEEAITDYLECLRQEQIKAQAAEREAQPPPEVPPKRRLLAVNLRSLKTQHPPKAEELPNLQLPRPEHMRPPRYKYLDRREGGIPIRLLVVAGVVIVLAILWQRHPSRNAENAAPRATAPAVATPPATSAPAPAGSATSAPTPAAPASGTSDPTAPKTSARAPEPETAPATTRSAQPGSSPPTHAAAPSNPLVLASRAPDAESTAASTVKPAGGAEDSDVTVRSSGTLAAAAAEKPVPQLTLVIRAFENSWISVSADGQSVSHERLIAPARTSVHAEREIVARVGNAAGVSFVWNGREIPAQGEEGEVKTFVFNAQGMRVIAASLAPSPQSP
jgi:cytoskeletal protein RodZ